MGSKGFKATWTEIKEGNCDGGFQCSTSYFCISKSLKCNHQLNCGLEDKSDEESCKNPMTYSITIHHIRGNQALLVDDRINLPTNFRCERDRGERVHGDRSGNRNHHSCHDSRLPALPQEAEAAASRASNATQPCSLPYLRVHWREICHKHFHGLGMTTRGM